MTAPTEPSLEPDLVTPVVTEAARTSPVQVLVRWLLTGLLLYLVFGVLIPSFATYEEIWAAVSSLESDELLRLGLLFVALELLKPMTNAVLVPGLGLRHAQLADAAASAISSTVPGPSGTAARFVFYRQYDVSTADFGRATVVNSLSNYAVALVGPAVGVAFLATQADVGQRAWTLALIGLGIALVGGTLVGLVLRSESFATKFGVRAQRATSWALGVVRRPRTTDVAAAVLRFRTDTLELLGRRGPVLAAVVVLRYAVTFAVLLVSVRAVGMGSDAVSLAELVAVFTLVQMLVIVQITPGGVGVTEALYISALAIVAEGVPDSVVVAAVMVFRIVTYLMPIILGAACYVVVTRGRRRKDVRPTAQRFGGPRPVLRLLVVWLATAAALGLMAWVLPGVEVSSTVGALGAAAVLGVLNAVVWPLVVWLALPLTVLTLGLGPLVLNGALVALAAQFSSGLTVSSVTAGIVVALGVTVVNTVVTALLAIDDDDLYYRRVVRRAAKRGATRTDLPGVLFLQIDGLGHAVLRRALRDGNAPTLAAWLRRGSHRLVGWETDWSSQTGASQAGILLGSNLDMPAFRWLEKDTGKQFVSNHPKWAAELEARQTVGGLLRADGASRGNIFTGGAADSVLTMSVAGRKHGRVGAGYFAYFANPYNATRTLLVSVGEVLRERRQAAAQRRYDVQPRVHRGGVYPFLRAFTTVISRDVTVATLVGDLYAGRSVVYADFLGYDEVAHHSGVERHDALDTLRRLDREFGRLERAAAGAPRPYRIVVLSDHGQSQGATFEARYGETLGGVVRRAMDAPVSEQVSGDESWGYAGGAMDEVSSGKGVAARALRRMAARRRTEEGVVLGPGHDAPAVGERDAAVVLGSGSLGLVHLTADRRRMSAEQITSRYPELLPTLVDHPGVGFLLVRSEEHGGGVVLGRDGARILASGEVRGTDPLEGWGPSAARQVARTDAFPHCADIMVNGMWDHQTDEVAAFEDLVGSHGGLGGEQTHPFVLYPVDLPDPVEPLHGAQAVHRLFEAWLAHLGHEAYAAPAALRLDVPVQEAAAQRLQRQR